MGSCSAPAWLVRLELGGFWVHFLHVCITNKERATISTCANTVRLLHSLGACLFPPLCKTGISKDTVVPKQSAAMGGAPTCQHSTHTHPTKVGVSVATLQ